MSNSKWSVAQFRYISIVLNLAYNKTNCIKLYCLSYWFRGMLNFDFLEKDLGIVSSPHFVYNFTRKNVSHDKSYQLTRFHCLIAFTSWDIGQYVYCNCLLTRLWRYKFWNWPYLSNQAVFLQYEKAKKKF